MLNLWKRFSEIIFFGVLISGILLAACTETTEPAAPKTCSELGQELRNANPDPLESPLYKVLSPNGGESFKVGDTLNVKAIAANNESDALIYFKIANAKGEIESVKWPNQNQGINLQETCEFSIILPESLSTGSRKVGLVSNQIWIKVQNYNQGSTYYDTSDASFSIKTP